MNSNVSDDCETVWTVYSVDAVNVAAADVRADEGDQCVRDVVDERDVDRPTDDRPTDADDRCRQTAGERRDFPGQRIDAGDPADSAFGDVQRAIGADGAALGTLQARIQSRNQQCGGRLARRLGVRRGRCDYRDQGRGQEQQNTDTD